MSSTEKESERRYVFGELLKSAEDIKTGRTSSAEDVKQRMDDFLNDLEKVGIFHESMDIPSRLRELQAIT